MAKLGCHGARHQQVRDAKQEQQACVASAGPHFVVLSFQACSCPVYAQKRCHSLASVGTHLHATLLVFGCWGDVYFRFRAYLAQVQLSRRRDREHEQAKVTTATRVSQHGRHVSRQEGSQAVLGANSGPERRSSAGNRQVRAHVFKSN